MRRGVISWATLSLVCAIVLLAAPRLATQGATLSIVDAAPQGPTAQPQDANEIRVIFSEPMVALGRIPSNPTPEWMSITPAIKGQFRWSGTTVLLFSPEPDTTLPASTRYTVRIDGAATSVAGRRLGTPYTFSFVTPTVKLVSLQWYRRDDRFDRPAILVLKFNQPVRPADVLAHTAVRYDAHQWDAPTLTDEARARLASSDAAGLRQFDAKVASARQLANRRDVVPMRLAPDWNTKTFPAGDDQVVLETVTAPLAGAWLRATIDTQITGAQGPERPPQPQSSVAELEDPFFVTGFPCTDDCTPSSYNGIGLTGAVSVARFAAALQVRDLTKPGAETLVRPARTVAATTLDRSQAPDLEDAGYDRQPPASAYLYQLPSTFQAADGQTLGYPWLTIVHNWHDTAFTSFGDGHGVWETGGGPLLPFYSRNFNDIRQWLVRLAPADLMPRILALEKSDFQDVPPGPGTVRRLPVTPDAIQSHGIDVRSMLSTGGTGLVWAGVKPGEPIAQAKRAIPADHDSRSTVVQVTNLGISVKDSPSATLVFVTRLDNGQAVADARVSVINTANRVVWSGTTGGDGIAMAPAMPLRDPENWYEFSFIVTAEKNGDVAYVGSNWNEGIRPWDFGFNFELREATDILRGSVFTDRGVYKPGEEIHVKAILRADTPQGIRLLPAGTKLEVVTSDARGREADVRTLTVNTWSSLEWTWTVPADATLGNYGIAARIPSAAPVETEPGRRARRASGDWLKQIQGSFLVAAYRRPDFRVDTTLSTTTPVAGATLNATLEARYLFGSAMGKRPVRWSITDDQTRAVPEAIYAKFPSDKYDFGYDSDERGPANRVAGETATLDAAGKLVVALPTAAGADDVAHRYTFEGDVEDVSRQHIASRSTVVVHPAPWYIGIRRPGYFVDTKTGTTVDVVAADLQGSAVAGLPITLTLTRVQWNSVRQSEGGGFYSWDTEEVKVPAGEWTVTSAATPVTVPIPVPEGGYYILAATSKDADGRSTRTETSFYGLGAGYTAWQRFDHNRITLEPERKLWKPGETARVMIQSPWESATALLTVEREGIRQHRTFTLTSTQQTVEVPISEADIPNVYVSVLLIRGRTSADAGADGSDPGKPAFRLGYTELKVEDATKRLAVKVSADKAEYRPANVAKVSVNVTDAGSRPARSEVTLWAVDYGVLSLTGHNTPDVLGSVYREKALQVMNEDSRQRIVSRRVLTPKGDGEGGGGGDDAGAGSFRRDFRPLAFWLGSVETDANGQATRDVMLPESLTTYRIMAVAADQASRFGSSGVEIKVNKPVTLLAAFPRFMSAGDRATFGAVVTNTLAAGGNATVTIRTLDPNVLQFQGGTSQTIQIGGNGTEPVRFDATARAVGTARVQMTVTIGRESDSFEAPLVVSAPAPVETSAAFGDTTDRTVERLTVPAGVIPGIGGLNVDLSSTALVGLGEGARYLIDYPYGCAEQRTSAAMALLLATDLGDAFNLGRLAPAEYKTRARQVLMDVSRFQCDDGGFGYWPGQCHFGNVYLTSYILHVLKVAEGLGIAVDADITNRAVTFLDQELKKTLAPNQVQWMPVWSASQAFSVKVLTEYGQNQDSNITRLAGMTERMPVFALSYLADAMASAGDRGPRYQAVVRRLTNALRLEGDQAHVEESDARILEWIWHTDVRSTAIVLDGFVRRGDDPAFVQRMVRWLLAARDRGRWGNTQENATALEALVDYYKKFEADVPDMAATVAVGTQPIGNATFRGRTTTSQQVRLAMPDLLRQVPAGAERDLAISRTGTGRLYYTSRLQYALSDPPPAVQQGMRVERRYEKYVENGTSPAATTFAAGDLIRVTLAITLPQERRYVAVTDALPAGAEAVESWFRTTASDIAREAAVERTSNDDPWGYMRGGFDHVERYDDRVALFATRLAEGRHEFSYLIRATTGGTFRVAGTSVEQMYAPEVKGRAAPVVVEIK